jgi:hypothetical protein
MPPDPDAHAAREAVRLILAAVPILKSAEAGRELVQREAFDQVVFDESDMAIERARRGDRDARAGVHRAIAGFVAVGEPVPAGTLRDYAVELLLADDRLPGRQGRRLDNHARDRLIAHAVRVAVEEYGFDRTRNRTTKNHPSACAIVRDVLAEMGVHMTESNVAQISESVPNRTPFLSGTT